jgi:hypothetical protein
LSIVLPVDGGHGGTSGSRGAAAAAGGAAAVAAGGAAAAVAAVAAAISSASRFDLTSKATETSDAQTGLTLASSPIGSPSATARGRSVN